MTAAAPTPAAPWFAGPYRVIAATRMTERIRLAPGEIMRHHTGLTFTTCPACGSTVMGLAPVLPPDDAPSLAKPLRCHAPCRRCDTWFQIVNGEARPAQAPPSAAPAIPERLATAGVRPPPRLPPGLE